MPAFTIEPLPFEEAIRFFEDKGLKLSPGSWRDVWAAENVKAFTVARVTSADVLEDIREAVGRAIKEGQSLGEFKAGLSKTLARKGWMAPPDAKPGDPRLKPYRLNNIFRTNAQSSYMAGRYKQMTEVAERRPIWIYDAVNDRRTRPSHAAHDGTARRYDHPFWDKWYPPNGFR